MRKWLKELRTEKSLTQEAISKELGISQNYYSCIENGERQKVLDFSLVLKIAGLFGVSIEWIAQKELEGDV